MVRGLVVALLVLVARTAVAGPARLEIVGNACDLHGLEAQIAQLAGEDPFEPRAPAVVRIATSTVGHAISARVTLDDDSGHLLGTRTIAAASCRELVKSLAVVVAMALPVVERATTVQPVAPAPRPPPPAPPLPPPPSAVSARAPRAPGAADATAALVASATPRRRAAELDVLVAGAAAAAGGASHGQLILGTRWRRGARSLTLELRTETPTQLRTTTMTGIDLLRAELAISPCLHVGQFAGCAVAAAGAFRGSGVRLTERRSATRPLLSAGLRLTWEHHVTGAVAVRLHAEADALLTTTRFDIDDMPVWTSSRYEALAGAGLLARFP